MIAKPLFRSAKVPGNDDRIAVEESGETVPRGRLVAIKKRFDKGRYALGAERSHGNGQMQALIKMGVRSLSNRLQCLAGGVLAVDQPRRNVQVPIGELRIGGLDP